MVQLETLTRFEGIATYGTHGTFVLTFNFAS